MQKPQIISIIILVLILASLFNFAPINKAAALTTVTYIIQASKDDAWSKIDDVKWDTNECYLSTADVISACRWGLNISKGATIQSANFICRARNNLSGKNTTVRIEVFDQDSCIDFDEIFWNWQVMGEYVDWRLPDPFLPNVWHTSIDLKTIVQAFIDRAGYDLGSYLGLRIKFQSGDSAGHEIWSWDFNPAFAAKLEVAYTPPEPPVADFSYTPENPIVNELVTFDATASYSPDSLIAKYSWAFGDATPIVNETDPIAFHNYTMSGFYNVTLMVVDNNGLTNSTTKTLRIRNPGEPVASFTYWPEKPKVNETITFNASLSYAPDGVIESYEWRFGDGANATEIVVDHAYNSIGIYIVTLEITDNHGMADSKNETISVSKYPIASFEYQPINPVVGQVVTFNASTSTPDGGSLVAYQWDFGDNTSIVETSSITNHTYSKHGNYKVDLNVTDSEGLWGIASKNVTVLAPPIALFTHSPNTPVPNESITFDASTSYDPDGTVVDFVWNFGDGNTTATSYKVISHVYSEHGNYSVTLTVMDNDGYSNTTFHIASVNTHDIAILNVTVSYNKVDIGQVVNISVTVKNEGTVSETFNITIFCNSTSIETLLVSNLVPNAERGLIFQWNTSNIGQSANFLIRAEVDAVAGENDVADNTYTDGIIEVSQIPDNRDSSPLDWKWMALLLIPLAILFFVGGITRKKKKANQNFRDFNFFDEITDGGIPDSFSVLVTGNPGSGKSMFCQQLTYKFLTMGKSCVYLTYDCFPNEVRENMRKFNWDVSKYEKEGKFVFVDCFSSIAQVTTRERYSVNQPFSLSDLGIMMSKATSEGASAPKVFFDSVVPLLTHIDQSKIVEFLQDRSARIKGVNGTFIFTVGKEAIEPNLLSRLEEVVDCVVEMDIDKSQGKTVQRLHIKKMRGRKASDKWIMFDVNPTNGIIFRG
jgi:KaiC/GvpD/RAD55 family RecA-like ATPase/PKD repeat protein